MNTIVVGLDGSPASLAALSWACRMAAGIGASVEGVVAWEVHAPYLAPHPPMDVAADEARTEAEQILADALEQVPDGCEATGRAVEGPAVGALVEAAEGAQALVVGAHGSGGAMPGLGSTAARCAIRSVVPTVVVPEAGPADPDGPVVVGVDGSATAVLALQTALRLMDPSDDVVAVDAWAVPGVTGPAFAALDPSLFEDAARSALDEALDALDEADRDRVRTELVHGDPRAVMRDEGASAKLLVIGTRGHSTLLHRLLGSTVTYLLHHHPTAVMVVPAEVGEDEA